LRSAFPIGSHLSGGLDSSSITCVARDLLAQTNKPTLHTFSNIFDDVPQCDERVFINAVLAEGNLIPHFIHADRVGPLTLLDEIFQHEEEGFFDPNHRLVCGLNQAAQQENIRIVLNGFDGDTTVSHGLLYFTELTSAGKWADFAKEAQAIERNLNRPVKLSLFHEHGLPYLRKLIHQGKWIEFTKQASQINKHFGISPAQLFFKYALKSLIPEWLDRAKQRFKGRKQTLSIEELIDSKFAQDINLKESIQARKKLDVNSPQTVRADQCQMLTSGLMAFSLELIDRTAAVFSQEARHPFMDKRLIEFCVALPPQQKLYQGWNRIVMRRAMNNILPQKVQWRPDKTNMSPNFIHGLLVRDKKRLDELVLNNSEQIDKYVNINTLRMAHEQWNSTGKVKPDDALVAWKTVTIALWIHYNGLSLNNTLVKEVVKKNPKKFAITKQ
jgi:asparagine synthase (glutamine-hydrolysing)